MMQIRWATRSGEYVRLPEHRQPADWDREIMIPDTRAIPDVGTFNNQGRSSLIHQTLRMLIADACELSDDAFEELKAAYMKDLFENDVHGVSCFSGQNLLHQMLTRSQISLWPMSGPSRYRGGAVGHPPLSMACRLDLLTMCLCMHSLVYAVLGHVGLDVGKSQYRPPAEGQGSKLRVCVFGSAARLGRREPDLQSLKGGSLFPAPWSSG